MSLLPFRITIKLDCGVHYSDVIMSAVASQISDVSIVCSTVCSGADHKEKHQSSASLAFVRGIHRWPLDSPHKGPVTRKMLPFDDVTMFEHTAMFFRPPLNSRIKQLQWPTISLYNKQVLTHRHWVTHICVRRLALLHWFRWTAPSLYLEKCWNIVNWTFGNKLQSNLNRNLYIFI